MRAIFANISMTLKGHSTYFSHENQFTSYLEYLL